MKKLLIFTLTIMLLASCQSKTIDIPSINEASFILSHVKTQALSFIDIEQGTVATTNDISFPITAMVKTKDGEIIAASKSENHLIKLNVNDGHLTPFLNVNQGIASLLYYQKTDKLYLTDLMVNKVHVIDLNNETIEASIEVGSYPVNMDFNNDYLFVLNQDSHSVSVIDTNTNQLHFEFPVVERPAGIFADEEMLWIGGHGSFGSLNKQIFAYDPDTGEQVASIEVGLMPIHFYADKHSPFLYVLCHGDHTLYKVNRITNDVEDRIEVGDNPNFLTGDLNNLYVTSLDGNTFYVIDRASFTIKAELAVAPGPYSIIKAGMIHE